MVELAANQSSSQAQELAINPELYADIPFGWIPTDNQGAPDGRPYTEAVFAGMNGRSETAEQAFCQALADPTHYHARMLVAGLQHPKAVRRDVMFSSDPNTRHSEMLDHAKEHGLVQPEAKMICHVEIGKESLSAAVPDVTIIADSKRLAALASRFIRSSYPQAANYLVRAMLANDFRQYYQGTLVDVEADMLGIASQRTLRIVMGSH